ncbi:unnamed protein product [Symbiodinium sp. CCMP2592]|nr:unnamed protein product [Symbiodinium sp. CCMP2592]
MAGVLMGYQAVTSDTDHSQAQDAGNERTIDPSGEDVYLDAIYLPLYFKFQRVNKGGTAAPHCKDYTLALLFLFLNVGLQLSIAFKMMDVTSTSYGSIERNLFHGTCWRMDSDRHDLWGILWPTSLKGAGYWDCLPPLLTLAARAAGGRQLDLDGDGFWSAKEAETLADRLQSLQATLDHHAFHRMVRHLGALCLLFNAL